MEEYIEKTNKSCGSAAMVGSETQRVLHILRNPYGYSATEIRQMQIKACNLIERYQDAYLNMRKFAEDNGLDTTTHG